MSRDPLGMWGDPGQRGNAQNYCGNNPVNRVDPLGLDDEWVDSKGNLRPGHGYTDKAGVYRNPPTGIDKALRDAWTPRERAEARIEVLREEGMHDQADALESVVARVEASDRPPLETLNEAALEALRANSEAGDQLYEAIEVYEGYQRHVPRPAAVPADTRRPPKPELRGESHEEHLSRCRECSSGASPELDAIYVGLEGGGFFPFLIGGGVGLQLVFHFEDGFVWVPYWEIGGGSPGWSLSAGGGGLFDCPRIEDYFGPAGQWNANLPFGLAGSMSVNPGSKGNRAWTFGPTVGLPGLSGTRADYLDVLYDQAP